MKKKVLLVDGHHLVREGLARLLCELPTVAELTQYGAGEEALRALRESREAPALAVFDVKLDGILHGIDLATALRREFPDTRLLVLTNDRKRSMIDAMVQAGADAYLLKTCSVNELEAAVLALLAGETMLSPGMMSQARPQASEPSLQELSRREREVLTLVSRGGTTKSIAKDLEISPKTVEKHRGKISKKLDLHSVAELTRFAIDNELV